MKNHDLRRRAEAHLPERPHKASAGGEDLRSTGDTHRLLHELQVHEIELEMQNAELQECRDRAETLLEKYIDLYDAAPVGYFSLNKKGHIMEVNLTGATLLGLQRSHLVSRSLSHFVVASSRSVLTDVLDRVFAGEGSQTGEVRLEKDDGTTFWADLFARPALAADTQAPVCRLAISDVTARKQAEDDRRQAAVLARSNDDLKKEIVRRQAVEVALKDSELHQRHLLKQSSRLQDELRAMSRDSIQSLENEHRRISRDLHDDIAQTLVGINVHLEALAQKSDFSPAELRAHIDRTQHMVEHAVTAVLQFARELRPASLEELGLNAALKTLLDEFMKRSGMQVHFKTFAGTDELSSDQRTTLYRIAQTALANVAGHSQASHVELRMYRTPDAFHLEIADNGKSFDVQQMSGLRSGAHLGLISMRERAQMLGGTFRIESEPDQGTTLHVQIPL